MKEGETLGGKYKLVQRLGKGAMGVVWEAVNVSMGRKVALKLIDRPTDDLRRRLLNEARVCGGLNHPNIVEVYDIGETDQKDPFLVMQLLIGETLADMLERKKRIEPPTLVARIGRDIASALDAAHSAKVIHRDLKPANIFLHREVDADESSFTVKVLDFGVSKLLNASGGQATMTGLMVGSPAYMSPEHLSMIKGLDQRTDIWSLGIILYEMLTGVRPFGGATVQDVAHQILSAPILPVSSRVRSVPPALDELVARCLERDRNKRFQDARSVALSLAPIAEVSAVSRVIVDAPSSPASGPERTLVASTPDAGPASPVSAQRALINFGLDGTPPAFPLRPMTISSPAATEGRANALNPRGRSAPAYPGVPLGAVEPAGGAQPAPRISPTGTQVMSPTAPVASPLPGWRREMQQAIEASRQPLETQSASPLESLRQDGTRARPPQSAPGHGAAAGQVPGVTTTTAPTAQPGVDSAATSETGSRRPGRGVGAWLYAAIGTGIILTIAALVAVVALGAPPDEATPEGAPVSSTSPGNTPAVKETPPALVPSGPSVPERASTTAVGTAVTPSPEPAATATSQPEVPVTASISPPAVSAKPPVKRPLRQPCGRFIKPPGCYDPKGKK